MISKALIIAPHPDDEINLAGQLIVSLVKLGIEIYVVYTTNGDAEKKIGNRRIYEAIEANRILGIDEKHVIFLGYPNEWSGETHIYNAKAGEALVSKLGKTETNSVREYPEYCFVKHGVHHIFTRVNFKNDYREVIEDILPDLIVCPEFDSHPDHRTAALLFDEIMGELLKEKLEYRPIILKKYVHEGVWYGPKDYYNIPLPPTKTEGKRLYSGGMHELDTPNFSWSDRISYATDESTQTELLRDNVIYKAAKKHKVTTAWYEMQRVINGDMVYWHRPTDNLALNATMECSSGNAGYVNDFKHFDTENVKRIEEPFMVSGCFCWVPDDEDLRKTIKMHLAGESLIKGIRIYEDCNGENHIKKLVVSVGADCIREVELIADGSRTEIVFDESICSDLIEIKVVEWEGKPGIAEIEVYSEEQEGISRLQFKQYTKEACKYKKTIMQMLENNYLLIKFLFVFKLKYEIKRIKMHFID